jgi:DNA-directed RNA polymerase subunit beta'
MNLIKKLSISFLSKERIKSLSFGNITSSKILTSRTFKPDPNGLFAPRIFGPHTNYECQCGKYSGKQNEGQKCERCETIIGPKHLQR